MKNEHLYRKFLSKWETKLENVGLINVMISSSKSGFEFDYDGFDYSNPSAKIIERNFIEFEQGVKQKIWDDFQENHPKSKIPEYNQVSLQQTKNQQVSRLGKIADNFDILNKADLLKEKNQNNFGIFNETNNEVTVSIGKIFDYFPMFLEGLANYDWNGDENELSLKPAISGDIYNSSEITEMCNNLMLTFPDYIQSIIYTDEKGIVISFDDSYLYEININGIKFAENSVNGDSLGEEFGGYGMIQDQWTDQDLERELIEFCDEKNIFRFVGARGKLDENYDPDNYSFIGVQKDLREMLETFAGVGKGEKDKIEYFDPNFINGTTEQVTTDPNEPDLLDFINTHNITVELVEQSSMGPLYKYSGLVMDLMFMLRDYWGNDPELLGTIDFDQEID